MYSLLCLKHLHTLARSLYDHWEPVTAADVQTPQEVYAELKGESDSAWGGRVFGELKRKFV